MSELDYGPLTPLLADPAITEVMVNGPSDIWVESSGQMLHTGLSFASITDLESLIWTIATFSGRRISNDLPLLDARLPDGSRVNAVLPPIALDGPVLTIRRFGTQPIGPQRLVELGAITEPALDFLHGCVIARRNILISGATATGKTTLLNCLSACIPDNERVITVEDAAELRLQQPHWVRLETRPADLEGRPPVTARDLVRNALRMRPDRIVVGEVRGEEALDMLAAMNTGHDGSLSSIHANSGRDALLRLETILLMGGHEIPRAAARDHIARALHLLVHIGRDADGIRRVVQIAEIVGREGEMITTQDIFLMAVPSGRGRRPLRLLPTGVRPRSLDAMIGVRHRLPAGLHRIFPDPRLRAA